MVLFTVRKVKTNSVVTSSQMKSISRMSLKLQFRNLKEFILQIYIKKRFLKFLIPVKLKSFYDEEIHFDANRITDRMIFYNQRVRVKVRLKVERCMYKNLNPEY